MREAYADDGGRIDAMRASSSQSSSAHLIAGTMYVSGFCLPNDGRAWQYCI